MAATHNVEKIRPMSETGLALQNPEQDIRGRKVIDSSGEEIGHVEDLYIDTEHSRVRFIQIGSGGILGIGEDHTLIPVDAVTSVDTDVVHINQTTERVRTGPRYNPKLKQDDYWERVYGHYELLPYWSAGYNAPPFPWF